MWLRTFPSVYENCPDAVHVFDHFHVVKLMNDNLDEIRRTTYHMEKDLNRRKVMMDSRYLLLMNGKDILDKKYRTRLENAPEMNRPLSQAYCLKENCVGYGHKSTRKRRKGS